MWGAGREPWGRRSHRPDMPNRESKKIGEEDRLALSGMRERIRVLPRRTISPPVKGPRGGRRPVAQMSSRRGVIEAILRPVKTGRMARRVVSTSGSSGKGGSG